MGGALARARWGYLAAAIVLAELRTAAGVLANVGYILLVGVSSIPLLGASGAISGVTSRTSRGTRSSHPAASTPSTIPAPIAAVASGHGLWKWSMQ